MWNNFVYFHTRIKNVDVAEEHYKIYQCKLLKVKIQPSLLLTFGNVCIGNYGKFQQIKDREHYAIKIFAGESNLSIVSLFILSHLLRWWNID